MSAAPSFRDPAGELYVHGGRVVRLVNPAATEDIREFIRTPEAQALQQSGRLIPTAEIPGSEAHRIGIPAASGWLVLEHERVPFPSYPYEWPPEMLHAAACLTLDLSELVLPLGFGLKDGTPYNVLFRGPKPVFVDVLSFEKRDPADPIWLPEAQFVRTFLLPLTANRFLGMSLDRALFSREGLEPELVYGWLNPFTRMKPLCLTLVSIPVWLGRFDGKAQATYRGALLKNSDKARFILETTLKRMRHAVNSLVPQKGRESSWSGYMAQNSYTTDHIQAKEEFVSEAIQEFPHNRMLDVGCNTGHFSRLCARNGAHVVAIDLDPVVVGETWRQAHRENLPILPLVVNLADPTPARGWRNHECSSFLQRAQGYFDGVIMLAVLHHLLITERVPLSRIVELVADLVSSFAVLEYVGPADNMFRKLLRGRDHLHADFNQQAFEAAWAERFEVVRQRKLDGLDRVLYLVRKLC